MNRRKSEPIDSAPSQLRKTGWLGLLIWFSLFATSLGQRPSSTPTYSEYEGGVSDLGMAALVAMEQATIAAIEKSERSVVAISRVRRDRAPANQFDPLRFGNPFPQRDLPENAEFVPEYFGSGVIVDPEGHVVTCAHVLDDPRQHEYFVWLNKQSYPARVVSKPGKVLAADPFSDLAVLKIEADNLTPITVSAAPLRKGQFVIALGNPQAIARDGQPSASWGIIANLQRMAPGDASGNEAARDTIHHFGTLIQTDAKLNLGTSGGALVNLKGEMVGLTTALAATSGFEQAAGFAIAVDDMFLRVVERLKLGKLPDYGFLGIQPEDLRVDERLLGQHGARVSVVIPGLPGELAGLRTDDVIVQVEQRKIDNRNDLFRELSAAEAGSTVQLTVRRDRPGRSSSEMLQFPAKLSKKLVSTPRISYSVNSQPKWRGMWVEYATAVPAELLRGGVSSGRISPTVSVLSVDPDTPAWAAGLRPGYGLLAVDGQKVDTPDEFYELVAANKGRVKLQVVRDQQRAEVVEVEGSRADQ